jgi:uncharacterized protein YdeI (YjbR/CyaY-like superfamily)
VFEVEEFCPNNRLEWREWLLKNHLDRRSVWLIFGKNNIRYQEALDEALCFGWIDGPVRRINEYTLKHYFAKRKPTSVWSAKNKKTFNELAKKGLVAEEGFKTVELAKQSGSYYKLDDLEQLILPNDLRCAFDKNPKAFEKYNTLCKTKKQRVLYKLVFLKRDSSREEKIKKIINEFCED